MPNSRAAAPSGALDVCVVVSPNDEAMARNILSRAVDKWSLWVLSELTQAGPLRFARLLERVEGISQKSLTVTLRQLERDGLVTRTVTAQVPIRVDYDATALGRALIQRVRPLWIWAVENLSIFVCAQVTYDEQRATEK
jgi:DNA-binding HxlR family transcriptional regulator